VNSRSQEMACIGSAGDGRRRDGATELFGGRLAISPPAMHVATKWSGGTRALTGTAVTALALAGSACGGTPVSSARRQEVPVVLGVVTPGGFGAVNSPVDGW
jgi:hypothetical protein